MGDYPVYPGGPVTPQSPVTGRGSELERVRLLRPLLTLNRAGAKARGWPRETSRGQGIGSVGCPLATAKDGVSDTPHSLRRCANGGSHQGVSPPRTVAKVLLGHPSSAWLMSIFQNHETQESLTLECLRRHVAISSRLARPWLSSVRAAGIITREHHVIRHVDIPERREGGSQNPERPLAS